MLPTPTSKQYLNLSLVLYVPVPEIYVTLGEMVIPRQQQLLFLRYKGSSCYGVGGLFGSVFIVMIVFIPFLI